MKKEDKKKIKKGIEEFKNFVVRGNALDLAVGVIVGGAFGKIVSSLVNDILMPIIGILIGGIDFSGLSITIENAKINYGMFIGNIVNFLIIAFSIFLFVKAINKLNTLGNKKKKEETKKEEVKTESELDILKEIRDELKSSKKKNKSSK